MDVKTKSVLTSKAVLAGGKRKGGNKIIDPCFKNVLAKELHAEGELVKSKTRSNAKNSLILQEEQKDMTDGIGLTIENLDGIEDLDYVDDVIEGDKLGDLEEITEDRNNESRKVVEPRLSWATGSADLNENSAVQQSSSFPTRKGVAAEKVDAVDLCLPSTSNEISDEELANMPRVKNLFNKFWEEKMKELKQNEKDSIRLEQ